MTSRERRLQGGRRQREGTRPPQEGTARRADPADPGTATRDGACRGRSAAGLEADPEQSDGDGEAGRDSRRGQRRKTTGRLGFGRCTRCPLPDVLTRHSSTYGLIFFPCVPCVPPAPSQEPICLFFALTHARVLPTMGPPVESTSHPPSLITVYSLIML